MYLSPTLKKRAVAMEPYVTYIVVRMLMILDDPFTK
jgi:hypothetical protein